MRTRAGQGRNPAPRRESRRASVLARLDETWMAFKETYAGLSTAQLLEPGVAGNWSVRDVIAHVTTWEGEALAHLPTILAGRTPPRYSVAYGGIDAFNALMTDKKKDLSLAAIQRLQDATHRRLVALVKRAPEAQLASETRFCRRLRADTYGHYPKHAAVIRRWRARSAGKDAPSR